MNAGAASLMVPVHADERPELPPEAFRALELLTDHLTPAGRRQFVQEMLDALALAQHGSSFQAFQEVLESWMMTFIALNTPDYVESVDRARAADLSQAASPKELFSRLGI